MPVMQAKETARRTFNVPGTSGNYAEEVITFGADADGQADLSFLGVTALIESGASGSAWPSGATVELWLPEVAAAQVTGSDRSPANYHYSGLVLSAAGTAYAPTGATASFGSATWPLAGYPGAQLRVKSGGVSGQGVVSATAD